MDIEQLMNDLAEAIATDADIETWCQNEYGKSVRVFMNFDVRNPPKKEDCPCVCLYPTEKQYGGSTYADAIGNVVMVYDKRSESRADIENILQFTGPKNVEHLRKLALRAQAGVVEATESSRIESVSVDYDTISQFAFALADQSLQITTPWTLGSGNPVRNE
ncbi:MAG: hypothetical protein K9J79_03825 [Desulfobacteraceae bacterium]|nr:hypothetical protein [Desulfobacteraceae bacterium]